MSPIGTQIPLVGAFLAFYSDFMAREKHKSHLEKFPEVGTAGREKHLVCRQFLALHPQGDVHKLLLRQQAVEGSDQLPLVVIPSKRISVSKRARTSVMLTISSCISARTPWWCRG